MLYESEMKDNPSFCAFAYAQSTFYVGDDTTNDGSGERSDAASQRSKNVHANVSVASQLYAGPAVTVRWRGPYGPWKSVCT